MSLLKKARVIEFPKVCDSRGNLSFVEGARHVPFSIRRIFYIYDVPGGETRGGHAHKKCAQVLTAVSGSFDLIITNGKEEESIRVNRANMGVLIPPGAWITMPNFTTGTVLLAIAAEEYDEQDYIRDYDDYLRYISTLDDADVPDIRL
ncbi:MAG TPA: hypothetical protein DC009_05345 [Porphyromonadaceae bacterium]|nr:hypothetical protein [Porphyromonadaceae bacterium]